MPGAQIVRLVCLEVSAHMVKKGQLEVSKMDSPRQGEPRDPEGPTPEGMRGHSSGAHGTASTKRKSGSQSQRSGTGGKQ
jgi:hypothetical protein